MLKFYILRSIRVMLSYLTSFNSMVASEGGDFDILYLPINPYLQDLCPWNRPWFITDACKKRQGDLETQELGFPFCILLWFLKWKGLVFLIHFTYISFSFNKRMATHVYLLHLLGQGGKRWRESLFITPHMVGVSFPSLPSEDTYSPSKSTENLFWVIIELINALASFTEFLTNSHLLLITTLQRG